MFSKILSMFSKILYNFGNFVANSIGDLQNIEIRLKSERGFTSEAKEESNEKHRIEYLWKLYPNINHRCSALLGHISIMLALSMYVLRQAGIVDKKILIYAGIVDVCLYVFLLILSLRTIRSFGLDKDFDSSSMYADEFFNEIAIKFSLVGIINALTAVGMICTLILLIIIHI